MQVIHMNSNEHPGLVCNDKQPVVVIGRPSNVVVAPDLTDRDIKELSEAHDFLVEGHLKPERFEDHVFRAMSMLNPYHMPRDILRGQIYRTGNKKDIIKRANEYILYTQDGDPEGIIAEFEANADRAEYVSMERALVYALAALEGLRVLEGVEGVGDITRLTKIGRIIKEMFWGYEQYSVI